MNEPCRATSSSPSFCQPSFCHTAVFRFNDGDFFYTLLSDERGEFRREDLSEAAFKGRNENIQTYSFWRSKFELPVTVLETLGKQTAEDLLRRYMAESSPELSNARCILAVMLERKKLLNEIAAKRGEDGSLSLIYEHTKTGEWGRGRSRK